ncbi:MAG: daptomycin-sensing surface protein LiaX [Alkalibacterium sp.]|nr:daptomycin-sensing surface protein LiaX [Alkalibacterium sp.]TVP90665.1 MAG: hypothetical protein EA249_07190 [Alkalibacterium sp.]
MNERDRILELMKKGVISTEEGLDLLESIANKEDRKQNEAEFDSSFEQADEEEQAEQTAERSAEQKEAEEALAELVAEINQYSVELDEIDEELELKNNQLNSKKEELSQVQARSHQALEAEKQEIVEKIKAIQKELQLIKQLDDVDTTDEIVMLREEINTLDKQLLNVEKKEQDVNPEEETELQAEVENLERDVKQLSDKKVELSKQLNRSKMKQWTLKAKQATTQFELPEDWKKDAEEELTKAGQRLEAAGKDWSKRLKKSLDEAAESDVTKTVKSNLENALGHFDWKDLNLKLPVLSSKEFKREWRFEDSTASILDFKLASGKITLKAGKDDTVIIKASGKLYGKMDEETPEESFDVRSTVAIDEDKLTCHIPNKRIHAELEVTLPERTYDYISLTLLNGKVSVSDCNAKDVFVKSTNGSLTFEKLKATMLEAKGSNGTISIEESELKDLLAGSVNGTVAFSGSVESADVSTTNGDIKLTFKDDKVIRINANTVNGNVKMALPKEKAMEGKAKTTFGKVKSRLSGIEPIESTEQSSQIKRVTGEKPIDFFAGTTTGNILLKDVD